MEMSTSQPRQEGVKSLSSSSPQPGAGMKITKLLSMLATRGGNKLSSTSSPQLSKGGDGMQSSSQTSKGTNKPQNFSRPNMTRNTSEILCSHQYLAQSSRTLVDNAADPSIVNTLKKLEHPYSAPTTWLTGVNGEAQPYNTRGT